MKLLLKNRKFLIAIACIVFLADTFLVLYLFNQRGENSSESKENAIIDTVLEQENHDPQIVTETNEETLLLPIDIPSESSSSESFDSGSSDNTTEINERIESEEGYYDLSIEGENDLPFMSRD